MTESLEHKNLTLKATKPPTKLPSFKASNLPTNQPSVQDSGMPTSVPTILDFSSMPSFQASAASSPTNAPYEPYLSLNNKHLIGQIAGAGAGLICIIAITCVGIYYELKSRSMKIANDSALIFSADDLAQQELEPIGKNSEEFYA